MSQHGIINVTCPSCHADAPTDVWSSINVQIDPDAKTELLNGQINIFQCNKCNYNEAMRVELFYHDMANKYCIQLFPLPLFWNKSYDRFTENGQLNVYLNLPAGSLPDYFKDTRIVFSLDEMIHYIIFRDKLALYKGYSVNDTQKQKGIKLLTGIGGSPGFVTGIVRNIIETPESIAKIMPGEIIVMEGAIADFTLYWDYIKQALAVVTDEGGMTCYIARAASRHGIPAITGTKIGSRVLKTGQKIIVDATRGEIYSYE
jgi:phosphohistidine swiveling domain-containing protein/Zn ribbon nucleic-acid-binding protein